MQIKDCFWPWLEAFVHVNGAVKPCCYAPTAVGNLHTDGSIEEIWNGPVMQELRTYIKANKLHPVCAGASCAFVRDAVSDDPASRNLSNEQRLRVMADSGSFFATHAYACQLFAEGRLADGLRYLQSAVDKRNPNAHYLFAIYLLEFDGAERGHALELLRFAAGMKHKQALAILGMLLSDPRNPEFDAAAAAVLLRDAGRLGHAGAFVRLAELHREGMLPECSLEEADKFLRLARQQGATENTPGLVYARFSAIFPQALKGTSPNVATLVEGNPAAPANQAAPLSDLTRAG
jgi:hypothetical protein